MLVLSEDKPDPIARFLAFAARRPDHPAVDLGDSRVTYGELETMARRLGACFASVGHSIDGPRVLIALPQGAQAYAAMIGTILSGGCYVPVNVTTPLKKLGRLIQTIRPHVIVAEDAFAEALAAANGTEAAVAGPVPLIVNPARLPDQMQHGPGRRNATAYVILTSGSTGIPKGVEIPMAALAHYVDWLGHSALLGSEDRVSQFPSISFDLSVLDIYGALSAGATLVPPMAEGDRLFPADFARRSRISVWISVPSAIELVMTGRQATAAMLRSVRRFVFCGEALRPAHLAAIFGACPAATVVNLYGPTEATVSMTSLVLRADDYRAACTDSAALGEPIQGMDLLLVGGGHPDEGEIVITGPQLASGYWRDPQRTAQAFRPIGIGERAVRGYFTGDWGERRGGQVFFRGRIDSQLKVRGYRIEAGEILARLAECGWPIACVLKHRDALVAVVEVPDVTRWDAAALRATLHAELDAHLVPAFIHAIERMPRNSNDKLDESAVRRWLDESADAPLI